MPNLVFINDNEPETLVGARLPRYGWNRSHGELAFPDSGRRLLVGGLRDGEVTMGSPMDLGLGPRPAWWRWRVNLKFEGIPPVVGRGVDLYLNRGDRLQAASIGGAADLNLVEFDSNLARDWVAQHIPLEETANMLPLRSMYVTDPSLNNYHATGGVVFYPYRYVAPVIHNWSGGSLNTNNRISFALEAIPPEIQ